MSEAGDQNAPSGEDEPAGEQAAPGTEQAVGGQAGAAQGGYVLDASALLGLINGEPGAERVAAVLPHAVISAVNLAEVAAKLGELGADAHEAHALLAPLHLSVVPLDEGTAFATGALRAATRACGLSLGDLACLALAAQRGATALTIDKAWKEAGERVGVAVEMLW